MAMSQLPSVLSSLSSRNTVFIKPFTFTRSSFLPSPFSPTRITAPQSNNPFQNARFFSIEEFSPELGEASPAWLQQPWQENVEGKILVNELISMGRHTKITAAGRVFSFSASVVIGTGNGTAGFGYGKAATPDMAVVKAQQDAQKNMLSLHFEKGGIPHDIIVNWRGTKVCIFKRRRGFGVKGNPTLSTVASAFGVEDISLKTHRSRNPNKIVLAMFRGLRLNCSKTPQERAREAGKKYVDWTKFWTPDHEVVKQQNYQYTRQRDRLMRGMVEKNIYDPEMEQEEEEISEIREGGRDDEEEDKEALAGIIGDIGEEDKSLEEEEEDDFLDAKEEEEQESLGKNKRFKGPRFQDIKKMATDPTIDVYGTEDFIDLPEKEEDKKHADMADTWAEDLGFYRSLKTKKRLKLKEIEESKQPKKPLYQKQKKRGY